MSANGPKQPAERTRRLAYDEDGWPLPDFGSGGVPYDRENRITMIMALVQGLPPPRGKTTHYKFAGQQHRLGQPNFSGRLMDFFWVASHRQDVPTLILEPPDTLPRHAAAAAFLRVATAIAVEARDPKSGLYPPPLPTPERFALLASCVVCAVMSGREENDRKPLMLCSRCKRTRPTHYCCRAHQKAHWKVHKKICTPLLELGPEVEPSSATADPKLRDSPAGLLGEDELNYLFQVCVDLEGSVDILGELSAVCRQWCRVARRDTLWRAVKLNAEGRAHIAAPRRTMGRVDGARQLRQLQIGTRADSVVKLDLNGYCAKAASIVDGGIIYALSTFPLPNLCSVTLHSFFTFAITEKLLDIVPCASNMFYPFRRLINQPGRKMAELRILESGIPAGDVLDLLGRHASTLQQLEITTKSDIGPFHLLPERRRVRFEKMPVPAAATVFGRPVFELEGRAMHFPRLTELTLDLRRRALCVNNAFLGLSQLRTLDLAISFCEFELEFYLDEDAVDLGLGDQNYQEWVAAGECYCHLTHLTLRVSPCEVGAPNLHNGRIPSTEAQLHRLASAQYPADGALVSVDSLVKSGLFFFFASARKLKVLRLLNEGFPHWTAEQHAEISPWPIDTIQALLRPACIPGGDQRNPLEHLEIGSARRCADEQPGALHAFLHAFESSLIDVDLTFVHGSPEASETFYAALARMMDGKPIRRQITSPFVPLAVDEVMAEITLGPPEPSTANAQRLFKSGGAPALRRFRVTRLVSGTVLKAHVKRPVELDFDSAAQIACKGSLEAAVRSWARGLQTFELRTAKVEPIRTREGDLIVNPPIVKFQEAYEQSLYNRHENDAHRTEVYKDH